MFCRVDPKHAGPRALGILVPHGATTLVVLRPRALSWDLLPARWDGDAGQPPQFCQFPREEAAGIARRLIPSLETAVTQGNNPVQTFGNGTQFQIWLRTEELVWIVCRRALGQSYQPLILPDQDEATREGEKIAAIVWPLPESRQEYYFNTQNFS